MPEQVDWIPCSDRMPDNCRTVLVTVESMEFDRQYPDMSTIGRYCGDHWQIATISEICDIYADSAQIVTAWAEMPVPYHVKDGDEADIWRMTHSTP